MISTQTLNVLCPSVLIVLIVLLITEIVYFYKKNKSKLNVHDNAIKIQPSKLKFILSWYVFQLCVAFGVLLLPWIFLFDQENRIGLPIMMLIIILIIAIPAYPYYTIIIHAGNLNGPTLWGWMWRREEMAISEIDKEKTLHRNIGRKLGIVIFYSVYGKKILSLGLDDPQVNQILELSSFATSKEK